MAVVKTGLDATVPDNSLFDTFLACINEIYAQENLARLPPLPPEELMVGIEGARFRDTLNFYLLKLADPEATKEVISRTFVHSLLTFCSYLPPIAFDAPETPTFTTSVVDALPEVGKAVHNTLTPFFADDVHRLNLFAPLLERLYRNLAVANGHPYPSATLKTSALTFPVHSTLPPREIVAAYAGGTPFAAVFQARIPFELKQYARFEHTHIVGGSGHGKTQLMQSLICDDLLQSRDDGRSIIVIDSQGDLINTISHLECFSPTAPDTLADRVVLIDPTDIAYPVCLNLFDWGSKCLGVADIVEREKLLNSAIALYEYLFGALLGAELTQKQGVIFKYLARLMLEIPDATIHTLTALMEDGEPFRPYMERLTGTARQFFLTRFFDRSFNETKKQILTRLWGVLSNGTLERIFGSPRNKVDLYEAMNGGKIVLINTAKDLLTQDGCALFGRFFIALIAQAAVQRAAIPAHERRPCFVYIDEAADYFDDTIEHLLNQARKYKVGLTLAHQNLDQLSVGLRGSLMASTSIKFAGGVSGKDARALAEEMHCEPELLQSMRKRKEESEFACYIRYVTPQAIPVTIPLGRAEAMPCMSEGAYEELRARNRARYCVPLEEAVATPASPALPESAPQRERHVATPLPREVPEPREAAVPPLPPARPPAVNTEPPVASQGMKPVISASQPPLMGRGGKQHKYLQHLIKQIAEEQGWRAVIEEPILDGAGRIDVALTRGDRRIACEISVTSTRDQELANVEKCLAAGYAEVILVAAHDRQRQMLQKYIGDALEEAVRANVRYVIAEELLAYLRAQEPPTEQTVRGYRVKVTREAIDPDEAEAKRKAIAAVIARSLRRSID